MNAVSLDTVVLGAIQGLTYGALAIGLVLVFRAQRFVNFAQANIGVISSVLLGKLVMDEGVPYLLALPVALAAGTALALTLERLVIRRLFRSPRLVLMVATIFLSQLLLVPRIIHSWNASPTQIMQSGYPVPFRSTFRVGSLVLHTPELLTIVVVPLLALGLAGFLRFSPYGQAIRAAAENPEAARLAGISVKRMSTLVWLIAGLLSAVAAILNAPQQGVYVIGGSGATILVRALAAGLIGRMTSLPTAFGAGIGIGVVEAITFALVPVGGTVELVIFVIVMGALLLRARELSRATRDSSADLQFGSEPPALPSRIAALPAVRLLRGAPVLLSAGLAIALPFLPVAGFNTNAKTFLLTGVTVVCLVGISLCVLSGWGGQVSLGQYALVGVGAYSAVRLTGLFHLPPVWVLPLAGLIGAGTAVLVGLPAIRIQGLFLAVSTLAFGVVAGGFAFQQQFLIGDVGSVFLERPSYLHRDRAVYYLGLGLVFLACVLVTNFRRSAAGRMLIAVKDNDKAARSHGITATGTRLTSFALSGFLCACAGVVFAYSYQRFNSTYFLPDSSFAMVTMSIIGGQGSILGAILGPLFVFGIPVVLYGAEPNSLLPLIVGAGGGLMILMFFPRGLAGLVFDLRDLLIRCLVADAGPSRSAVSRPHVGELLRAALGRDTPAPPEPSGGVPRQPSRGSEDEPTARLLTGTPVGQDLR